jgi:hypothetical protein
MIFFFIACKHSKMGALRPKINKKKNKVGFGLLTTQFLKDDFVIFPVSTAPSKRGNME